MDNLLTSPHQVIDNKIENLSKKVDLTEVITNDNAILEKAIIDFALVFSEMSNDNP